MNTVDTKNKYFSTLKAILGLIALVLVLPNFVFKGLIAFFGLSYFLEADKPKQPSSNINYISFIFIDNIFIHMKVKLNMLILK